MPSEAKGEGKNPSSANEGEPKSTSSTKPSYTPEEQEINEQFLNAVLKDDLNSIKKLLPNPLLDINTKDPKYGDAAIIVAVQESQIKMIKLLLSHPKVDLNVNDKIGKSPLEYAALSCDLESIKILSNHGTISAMEQTKAILAVSKENDLQVFKILLEYHTDKYFIKNHALEIFAEAAKIIDGVESFDIEFLDFVSEELIKQTSPQEALETCIRAIPSFGGFEPTFETIFARTVIIPVFRDKLNNQEIIKIFDKTIEIYNQYDTYAGRDIAFVKDYLQRWHYLEESHIELNGNHITIENE